MTKDRNVWWFSHLFSTRAGKVVMLIVPLRNLFIQFPPWGKFDEEAACAFPSAALKKPMRVCGKNLYIFLFLMHSHTHYFSLLLIYLSPSSLSPFFPLSNSRFSSRFLSLSLTLAFSHSLSLSLPSISLFVLLFLFPLFLCLSLSLPPFVTKALWQNTSAPYHRLSALAHIIIISLSLSFFHTY